MPTYVCSVPAGLLSPEQKAAVAQAISRVHSEATGAPTYFVQVIISECANGSRFLDGVPADGPVWIRGDIRAGRSEAVRKTMILRMMQEIAPIARVEQSEIWIYLCNLAATDMIEYGHVLPPPGEEAVWFDNLPDDLRIRLATKAEASRPGFLT